MVITPKLIYQKRILKKYLNSFLDRRWSCFHSIEYLFLIKILTDFISLLRDNNYSFSGLFINRNNFSFYMVLFFIITVNYYNFYFKYFLLVKNKNFNFLLSDLFLIRAVIILFAITII